MSRWVCVFFHNFVYLSETQVNPHGNKIGSFEVDSQYSHDGVYQGTIRKLNVIIFDDRDCYSWSVMEIPMTVFWKTRTVSEIMAVCCEIINVASATTKRQISFTYPEYCTCIILRKALYNVRLMGLLLG